MSIRTHRWPAFIAAKFSDTWVYVITKTVYTVSHSRETLACGFQWPRKYSPISPTKISNDLAGQGWHSLFPSIPIRHACSPVCLRLCAGLPFFPNPEHSPPRVETGFTFGTHPMPPHALTTNEVAWLRDLSSPATRTIRQMAWCQTEQSHDQWIASPLVDWTLPCIRGTRIPQGPIIWIMIDGTPYYPVYSTRRSLPGPAYAYVLCRDTPEIKRTDCDLYTEEEKDDSSTASAEGKPYVHRNSCVRSIHNPTKRNFYSHYINRSLSWNVSSRKLVMLHIRPESKILDILFRSRERDTLLSAN